MLAVFCTTETPLGTERAKVVRSQKAGREFTLPLADLADADVAFVRGIRTAEAAAAAAGAAAAGAAGELAAALADGGEVGARLGRTAIVRGYSPCL